MLWRFQFWASAGVLLLIGLQPVKAETSPRQLVYAFSYGSQQSTVQRGSQNMDVGSGSSPQQAHVTSGNDYYGGALGETGTITVEIVRVQPDKGLIVSISEQGRGTRSAAPATCVAYGNTLVICDPNKTVNSEEYTLLRFLGPNFIDPNQLDAKRHWAIDQPGGATAVKSDYVIEGDANGLMTIGETRTITQANAKSTTTDVQTKIGYDLARTLPVSIDEYVTERRDNGVSGSTRTIYQTTLKLASDSAPPAR